jgi:hypothetical protein
MIIELSLELTYYSCSFSNSGWWTLSFTSMDCILYQLYTVTTFSSVRDLLRSWEMHQRIVHNLYINTIMLIKNIKIHTNTFFIEKSSILRKVRGVRLSVEVSLWWNIIFYWWPISLHLHGRPPSRSCHCVRCTRRLRSVPDADGPMDPPLHTYRPSLQFCTKGVFSSVKRCKKSIVARFGFIW